LTQSGATANGNFDLQFTLYDAQTGGTPRSDVVTVNNVTVANGIFTVPLNFYTSLYNNYNARFLEISVRPAGSSVAFTVLTPRQPITDVPFAVNALNAVNTANLEGKTANQFLQISPTAPQTGSFNLSGDGRIGGNLGIVGNTSVGGNLTVSGTITTGCRSGFTAIAGGRLCVSAMQTAATFYGATGAIKTCANMQARVGNSADLMLTIGTTFDYRGGLQRGWLADHIGDNVWGTWINSSGETDFDDAPLNVYNGSNGSAPSLPYRCVY
jgi:hypothetical protein